MGEKFYKIVLLLLSVFGVTLGGKTPSGLYHDDGHGHTILTQKFSRKDVREISYDILNIMGFHHRPHPHLVDSANPASQFLLEVYNSLGNADVNVDLSNGEHGRKSSWSKKRNRLNLTWSEFNVDEDEVSTISNADTITSFINRGHKFSDCLKNYTEDKQFWFDVSEVPDAEAVLGAELRLWKRTLSKTNKAEYDYESGETTEETSDEIGKAEVIRLGVHQVVLGKVSGEFELVEVDETVAAKWEQGWLRLNVTTAFRTWITEPESNFGLVITIKSAESGEELSLDASGLATILNDEAHQPFVVAFMKDLDEKDGANLNRKPKRRVRRAPKEKQGRKKKSRQYDFAETLDRPRNCQMGMLYVNFDDLGWKDWVIAPDGFIAYYCHGECSFPLTASMNATNHAIVSTLVHTYYPLEYPKPSCSPVKLGSISMLYYDDNSNVTVKKYKDMVIKSCGCK